MCKHSVINTMLEPSNPCLSNRCWRCGEAGIPQLFELGTVWVCPAHKKPSNFHDFKEQARHPAPIMVNYLLCWTQQPKENVRIPYFLEREIIDHIDRELRFHSCHYCKSVTLQAAESFDVYLYQECGDEVKMIVENMSVCYSGECGLEGRSDYYYINISHLQAIRNSVCKCCNRRVKRMDKHVRLRTESETVGRIHYDCADDKMLLMLRDEYMDIDKLGRDCFEIDYVS